MRNVPIRQRLFNAPTPMAGLALGIGSLGWCWEAFAPLHGHAQEAGAAIAGSLLLILAGTFLCHPRRLLDDLKHPVVGSVVPTFSMATMVVSACIGRSFPYLGASLWLLAVALHLGFLATFTWHRARAFELHHMVPAWFVPPVGIIVADVSFPHLAALHPLANGLQWFGMLAYALMLPAMIYRLIFAAEVPDPAKPTIAIMAAPASLSLAGYLTVCAHPSMLLVALLGGIAVLMTAVIYIAFLRLLRLPFSPGYAAFTFPMVIGVTALAKTAAWMRQLGAAPAQVNIVQGLADVELAVATVIVSYVAMRYLHNYLRGKKTSAAATTTAQPVAAITPLRRAA